MDFMLLKLVRDRQVKRQSGAATENDLLQMLLDIASANTTDIPTRRREAFILDNCRTIYFASSAATSLTASWTLVLLSQHPEWQDRIRAEIVEVCGDPDKLHHCLGNPDVLRKFKVVQIPQILLFMFHNQCVSNVRISILRIASTFSNLCS